MITFSMVDVSSISSNISRSNFSESELEVLAEAILDASGLLKPLVLKKTGFEQYQVIGGHFEYYAAVKACEKNPRQAEMVNALVVSEDAEQVISKQLELLIPRTSVSAPATSATSKSVESSNVESRLRNLEVRLEQAINTLRSERLQDKESLESRIATLESQSQPSQDPLEQLNSLSEVELVRKLKRSIRSGAEKIAKAIVNARNKKPEKQFEDYRDVRDSVRGLGEKRMLTIIDDWSRR